MELIKGKEYKRKELHDFYVGQRQGGISTPKEHPYIFIISSKRYKDLKINGEGGIRTHEQFPVKRFRIVRFRPLSHLSVIK